jgi:hypothetical protein
MRVLISVCTRMSSLIPTQFVNITSSPVCRFETVPMAQSLTIEWSLNSEFRRSGHSGRAGRLR